MNPVADNPPTQSAIGLGRTAGRLRAARRLVLPVYILAAYILAVFVLAGFLLGAFTGVDVGSRVRAQSAPDADSADTVADTVADPVADTVMSVLISEVMFRPRAVANLTGEWIELYNGGAAPINLRNWTLATAQSGHHMLRQDVWVAPGAYVVLGRSGDPAHNGGIVPAYIYADVELTNAFGDIALLAPNGTPVDQVPLDDLPPPHADQPAAVGASLERVLSATASGTRAPVWVWAHGPWPGSAGDWGSPNAPYTPRPTPTATSGPTPLPAMTHTPTGAPVTDAATPPTVMPTATWTPLASLPSTATPHANTPLSTALPTASPTWSPALPPTVTPTVTPNVMPTIAPTVAPSATPSPAPAESPAESPTNGPTTVRITEVMVDPHAVADHLGEWIELHNPGAEPVNLLGWQLEDTGRDRHVIAYDRWLAPGAYAVLARHGDPSTNGGVAPIYVYSGLQLANDEDLLHLVTPGGIVVDQVAWGAAAGLRIRPGISLERSNPLDHNRWVEAIAAWPGSAGDWGTPGQAFAPRPAPAPQPDSTFTPVATPTPNLGSEWLPVSQPGALRIDQVYYDSAEHEFVTLINDGPTALTLDGYLLGDAERPGKHEGIYALPAGLALGPGQLYIIARNAAHFRARWGVAPHAEIEDSDPQVANLLRRGDLAGGSWALNNSGDEIVLLDGQLRLVDALVVAEGDFGALAVTGALHATGAESLQRVPGLGFPSVADQRHRFVTAAAAPHSTRTLPAGSSPGSVPLGEGLRAAWGSLGVSSALSAGGHAPPHYLLAAAAAHGLDFLAIADAEPIHGTASIAQTAARIVQVPAWRWQGSDGTRAVVYSPTRIHAPDWPTLASAAQAHHVHIQAQSLPADPRVYPAYAPALLAADDAFAPGGMGNLYQSWRQSGAPLLPAGNSAPPIPGLSVEQPRYTGLAIAQPDLQGILHALQQRRGWLTTRPGLWLTLRATDGIAHSTTDDSTDTTNSAWMGSSAPAAAETLALEIHYGDRSGTPAGLAVWQDGALLYQLDGPPHDGNWRVQIPAQPGSFVYAVATQLSGDFAITAPLLITAGDALAPTPVAAMPVAAEPGSPATSPPATSPPATSPPATIPDPMPTLETAVETAVEITEPAGPSALDPTHGQAGGPPGSLAQEKLRGIDAGVEFRAQVTVPPGLFNAAIYVAEPARLENGATLATAGLGIRVYLRNGGSFTQLAEGDWVLVRGRLRSYRGELEVQVSAPDQVWRIGPGAPLQPLNTRPAAVGEALESRLISLRGAVVGWQGDSIYLADLDDPQAGPVRVTVRSSLDWKRPFVQRGEIYQVTGILSQFAQSAPWNGGYRILLRYPEDILKLETPGP